MLRGKTVFATIPLSVLVSYQIAEERLPVGDCGGNIPPIVIKDNS